jgi:leucyl aminopeptidase
MNFTLSSVHLSAHPTDLLAVGVADGALAATLSALLGELGADIAKAAQEDELSGKVATAAIYPTHGRISAARLCVVGVGGGSVDELRRAAGKVGHLARSRGARQVTLALGDLDAAQLTAVVEGYRVGNYRFDRYKPAADQKAPTDDVTVVGAIDPSALSTALAIADGQALARDLVNEQPAVVHPERLAEVALGLASEQITVDVWDEERIRAAGMGGIIAVGQGSARPPRFIHLTYKPAGTPRRRIAIVGKGVTFDSGGLSLKPSDGMLTMRCDMSGAAAVLGAMLVAGRIQPDVEVHGIIGAVENMMSGNSYKLGDILTMMNGKTVEVHNTDAEGRLVLADCLTFASRLGVESVVDLATLTGACVVALGDTYTGLFTPNEALSSALLGHAQEAGEHLWRMPLPDHYREKIKAEWGHIKNVGGREGGAITAALFLSEFVDGPAWAHLDIAGPAFFDKPFRHFVTGGSGALVPTLARWIQA